MNNKQSSTDAIREINKKYNDPMSDKYMNLTWKNSRINAINNNVNTK